MVGSARRGWSDPIAVGAVDFGYAEWRRLSALRRVDPRSFGPEPPGPAVLLLPGVYGPWETLEPIARRLGAAGYTPERIPRMGLNIRPIPETAELVADYLRARPRASEGIVIVGHSKGGIVGKLLLTRRDPELGIRGLVAIASPWHGSERPRLTRDPALREFLPESRVLLRLKQDSEVNQRITTIRPALDQNFPEHEGLPGAVNIRVPVRGHTLVLRARATLDAVVRAVARYSPPDIEVAAVVVVRERRVLMVTARGRELLYMPGGKLERGETPAAAAAREAREEVGLELDPAALVPLTTIREPADGEPGRQVRMHLFLARSDAEPRPCGEVDAVHWVDSRDLERCPPAGRRVLLRLLAARLID